MKTYLTNGRAAPRRDASQIGVTPRGIVTQVTFARHVQTMRYWVTAGLNLPRLGAGSAPWGAGLLVRLSPENR
jgi:hypothetical protein